MQGAKYHVPANTPYARYFSRIFCSSISSRLCRREAASAGALSMFDYGNKKAGEKMKQMLAMGMSKPWRSAEGDDRRR